MCKLKAYTFTINTTHFQKYLYPHGAGGGEVGKRTKGTGKKNNTNKIEIKQERLFGPMRILCPEMNYLSNSTIHIKTCKYKCKALISITQVYTGYSVNSNCL